MLRVYLHTSNIEQHKIAVYERKAHITAEVTESIADFVAHAERARVLPLSIRDTSEFSVSFGQCDLRRVFYELPSFGAKRFCPYFI